MLDGRDTIKRLEELFVNFISNGKAPPEVKINFYFRFLELPRECVSEEEKEALKNLDDKGSYEKRFQQALRRYIEIRKKILR